MLGCGVAILGCGVAMLGCGVVMLGCGVAMLGCGVAMSACGVAMLGCGVAMLDCGVAMSGCDVAMWLVRRAAVRQARVRIPPRTPPLIQPRKVQEQESNCSDFCLRSSRRVSPSPRMNIVSIL
jgi:hypothetical protein